MNSQSSFFVKHSEVCFEHFFTISTRMMRYCGYDFRCLTDCVSESEQRFLILKNIWYWTIPSSGAGIVFLIILEAYQSNDIGKLALAISTALSTSVFFFIVSEFQRNKIKIFNFFEELKQDFPTRSFARNACFFNQKLSFTFFGLWLFISSIICLIPLTSLLFLGRKILFYPAPDFMLQGTIYPFAYLWMSITGVFIISQSFTLTLNIVILILIVCLKFDQLAYDISAFKHSDELEIFASLQALIKRHINALKVAKKLDELFSVIFFGRFVVSIFAIGIDFFAILSLKNPSDICLGLLLIMSEFNQLFLICCIGQMLVNANNRITTAIYVCGWENWTSLNFKKSMLMILQKTQDPATLTIWKFGSVSLELFTAFSKSMYDITSFMLAIYENKN